MLTMELGSIFLGCQWKMVLSNAVEMFWGLLNSILCCDSTVCFLVLTCSFGEALNHRLANSTREF